MNPRNLFSLTPAQRERYLLQPDSLNDYNLYDQPDEYEHPPYLGKATLRFWYNTQDYGFPTHWHNAQEMIVPLEEGYTVTCQSKTYKLEPGDIFLIPPGELHSMEAPPAGARFIFLFELDLFGRISDFSLTRTFLTKPVLISQETCPSIYRQEIGLILQTAEHYWSESTVRQMFLYSCMLEFFALYTDFCTNARPGSDHPMAAAQLENSQKLNFILHYMEQNYAEKLTLESVASMAGLSKFYFTRLFKQYTGQTFQDYLNRLRIQASENLLTDTSVSITHIAEVCGYSSISSFNRCFRSIKGCTPSEFRNIYSHKL